MLESLRFSIFGNCYSCPSAGWINRQQLDATAYLKEENRILREQMGKRWLRFTNDQRRRLAARAKMRS